MKKIYFLFITLIFLMGCLSSPQVKKDEAGTSSGTSGSSSSSSASSTSDLKWQTVDNLDNIDNWNTANGDGTAIETKSVSGKNGKAVEIDYDLADTKQWVAISTFSSMEVSKDGYFRFWVKGTGARNAIEFKMVDIDGSNFIKAIPGMTAKADWTQVVIPLKSLIYGWGGDQKLDALQEIWISVTMAMGGKGGKGTVAVDELEYSSGK